MSSIKIKKSKQGSLHTHLGVPQGKKIPASKLKIKSTDSPAIKKKKQFAINAKKWKHEDGGLIPEYSWGGVLADAAAGAGMGALSGSAVPGIGTAIGAVIGGAGAFLKGAVGEITGNKQEKLELAQQRIAQANNSFNTMMGNGIQNPFTATFAMGGRVGSINAEIEKGETALSPDGTMYKFQLPSHANSVGDNFKSFDPGTMIFSDKLKFSKNKTFAQEQNRWLKLSAKADKTIKNPGSTFLNKKTANLNKQNSLKMSVDLFGKQEAMKMSKGGSVPGKFWGGGTAPWWQQGPFYPGSGYTANGIKYPSPDATFNAMTYNVRPGTYANPNQLSEVAVQDTITGQPTVNNNAQSPNNTATLGQMNLGYSGFGSDNYQWPRRNNLSNAPIADSTTGRVSANNQSALGQVDLGYRGYGARQSNSRVSNFQIPDLPRNFLTGDYATTQSGGTRGTGTTLSGPESYGIRTAGFNRAFSPGNTINNVNPITQSLSQTNSGLASVSPNNPTQDQIKKHLKDYGVGPDWGGIGLQALSLAPDIYNLGQALFSKPEKIERNRYFNPYTNQIRSRMNDRRFNIDPILAANRNANAIYNRNVSNASGGDRSRLLSNLLAGQNARQSADAAAYSQKINMDNQYIAEQAQMDYNLGAMNANALAMRDDINARNLAAKRNFGAAAASGMQRYALNQMQMDNQLASQKAYLDVLERVNPFFNPWLNLDQLKSYGKYNR